MSKPIYLSVASSLDSGEPFFQVHSIEGEERISGDFQYTLKLTSRAAANLNQMVGDRLTVAIRFPDQNRQEAVTYINGIVMKISGRGWKKDANNKKIWDYDCQINSFLAPLSLARDYRIFQEAGQDCISIVTKLFQEFQFDSIDNKTKRPYSEIPFCVQYNESATNFFERWMEREGIGYYFSHAESGHTLVLEDDFDKVPVCPGAPTLRLKESASWDSAIDIVELREDSEVVTAKYTVNDYSCMTAPNIHGTAVIDGGMGTLKTVHYPSGVPNSGGKDRRLRDLKNSEGLFQNMLSCRSHARGVRAGHKFTLEAPEQEGKDGQEYVVHSVYLKADQRSYENTFKAFPAIHTYRPRIDDSKLPKVYGYQTAVVVGEGDNKTNVDNFGSVRVHFHWDLRNPGDDPNSSCYIRYSTPYAGPNRGFQFPPYIGDEVVVTFENGDPDRPLAIGSVFGPGRIVPGTVRNHPRRSTIKTTNDPDSNQLMFEDKEGEESFNVIAKKDYTRKVQNQEVDHIQSNRQTFIQKDDPAPDDSLKDHLVVDGNRKIQVKKDNSLEEHINEGEFKHTVAKSHTTEVEGVKLVSVKKDHDVLVTKSYSLTVKGDTLVIEANGGEGAGDIIIKGKTVTLSSTEGNVKIESAADMITTVEKSASTKISGGFELDVAKDMKTKIGGAGKTEITADSIMKASGAVKMEGMKISIKGGAGLEMDGGAKVDLKGGMVGIKGGLVKIN